MAHYISPPIAQVAGTHIAVYEALYKQADASGKGVIMAMEAARFLKRFGLSENILSQIWDMSDPQGKGYLDKQSLFTGLKLIALAQNGKEVSYSNMSMAVPPPNMGSGSPSSPGMGSFDTSMSIPWAVTPTEKTKYDQIFDGLGPVNGLLPGDKVRPVLMNSKLPVDILGRVWDLSDLDKDGFLDREEFALAMHLVYKALEQEPVPATLPETYIPPSKRKSIVPVLSPPPVIPILPPVPGSAGLPLGPGAAFADLMGGDNGPGSPRLGQTCSTPAVQWVVTPADKVQYDDMFHKADLDKDGFVNGLEVKDIFIQSGVAQSILAHIWNLCDMKGVGKLNTEQFALIMYLIKQKLNGIDPPHTLPPEMIPPSMRAAPNPDTSLADTSGMKELDMISKEIDTIKKQKMALETEKAQKEADLKIRNGEVAALQKEMDGIQATVKQLETQKSEAQKRLDELDDKKMKMEQSVADCREKCEDEQKQINQFRSTLMREEMSVKNQEEELKRMKDELSRLRQEEMDLEQKVEQGKVQLHILTRNFSESGAEISKTKVRVQQFQEVQNSINQSINQYNALISGDPDATEPSPIPDADSIHVDISTLTNGDNGFSSKDPFPSTNGLGADPFSSEDPFKNSSVDDPFNGKKPDKVEISVQEPEPDPFKGDGFGNADPFAGKDPFSSTKSDPFGGGANPTSSDPWAATFPSAKSSAKNAFDPFGGKGAQNIKSPINPEDPFGTGSFMLKTESDKKSRTRSKSPARPAAPSLPPKQKKAPPPPRPPAPKASKSKSPPNAAETFTGQDPWGGGGVTQSSGSDGFGNFADFSPNKFGTSEQDQFAWATRNSEAEYDFEQKKKEQEERDLAMAIKLSKEINS